MIKQAEKKKPLVQGKVDLLVHDRLGSALCERLLDCNHIVRDCQQHPSTTR